MSALTAGNWIAFQNEAQKRDIDEHGPRWSIGLDHPVELCRGVNGSDYMLVSGICTEADAMAMAASKDLIAALKTVLPLVEHLQAHPDDTLDAEQQDSLYKVRAVLAKAGA